MIFKPLDKMPSEDLSFEINKMLVEFIIDSRPNKVDKIGFYDMTLMNTVKAILGKNNDHKFWLLEDNGKPKGFVLTNITVDIDNSRCLYLYAGYADKSIRCTPIIKKCIQDLKDYGRKEGCKYSVVVAGRNPKAYKRFLGNKTEDYCTLLKEKL